MFYYIMISINKPRKILGYNHSKLMTLPKFWIDHHNLKKGDLLKCEIDDEMRLVIKPVVRK